MNSTQLNNIDDDIEEDPFEEAKRIFYNTQTSDVKETDEELSKKDVELEQKPYLNDINTETTEEDPFEEAKRILSQKPQPPQTTEEKDDWYNAWKQSFGQPLESIADTAEVFGFKRTAEVINAIAPDTDENYISAGYRFTNPKEDDFQIMGFAPEYLPRAVVEQTGQLAGSMLTRALGVFIGGAIGAPAGPKGIITGAATGGFIGPALFEAIQIAGPTIKERARNQGRAEGEYTWDDITAGLATAAGTGALNAVGAKYLPGGQAAVGGLVKRVTSAMLTEGATETGQGLLQQIGSTLLTEKGLEIKPKEAIAEGIIGGTAGGASTIALSPFTKGEDKTELEPTETEETTLPPIDVEQTKPTISVPATVGPLAIREGETQEEYQKRIDSMVAKPEKEVLRTAPIPKEGEAEVAEQKLEGPEEVMPKVERVVVQVPKMKARLEAMEEAARQAREAKAKQEAEQPAETKQNEEILDQIADDLERQRIPNTAIKVAQEQVKQATKETPAPVQKTAGEILLDNATELERTDITPSELDDATKKKLLDVARNQASPETIAELKEKGLIYETEGQTIITESARLALDTDRPALSEKARLEQIRDRFDVTNDDLNDSSDSQLAASIRIAQSTLPDVSDSNKIKIGSSIDAMRRELRRRSQNLVETEAGNRAVVDNNTLLGLGDANTATGFVANTIDNNLAKGVSMDIVTLGSGNVSSVVGFDKRTRKVRVFDKDINAERNVPMSQLLDGKSRLEIFSDKESRSLTRDEAKKPITRKYEPLPTPTAATPTTAVQPEVAPTTPTEAVAPTEVTPTPTEATPTPIPTEATTPPAIPTEAAVAPVEAQETPAEVPPPIPIEEAPVLSEEEARNERIIDDAINTSREARKKNPRIPTKTIEDAYYKDGKIRYFNNILKSKDLVGKNIREVLKYISELNLGDDVELNRLQDIAASMLTQDIEIYDIYKIKGVPNLKQENFTSDRVVRAGGVLEIQSTGRIEISSTKNTSIETLLHEIGHATTKFEISKAIGSRNVNERGSDYLAKINKAIESDKTREPVKRLLKLYVDTIEQLGLTKEYFGDKKGIAGNVSAESSKNAAKRLQNEGKLKSKVGKLDSSVFYGLANVEEFVAQTFNSEEFRGLMSTIKVPQTKKSLYRAIVEAIRDILRLPSDSVAYAIIDTTFDIGYINAYPAGFIDTQVSPLLQWMISKNKKLSQIPISLLQGKAGGIYLRAMFDSSGSDSNQIANEAFTKGLIKENSTDALFAKLEEEITANESIVEKREGSKERANSIKSKALSKEPSDNKTQIPVNELNYGDKVLIDGKELSVTTKNNDTNKVMLVDKETGDRVEFDSAESIQIDKDSLSKTPAAPKSKPYLYNEVDPTSDFAEDIDTEIDIQPTILDRIAVLGETITNFFTGKGKDRGKYEKGIKFLGRGNRSPEVQAAIERIAGGENAIAKELKFVLNRLTKLAKDSKTPLSNIFQAIGDIDYNLTKEQYNNLSFAEIEARKQFEINQIRRIKGDATANQVSKLSNTDRENWIADRNNINREDAIKLSQESELAGIEARNNLSKKFISQNYEEAIRTKRSLRNELPEEILNEVSSIEANLSKVLGDSYKDGILPNRFKPRQNADAITLERYYKIKGDKAYAKKYRENPRYMEKLVSAIESLTIDARTKRYLERGVPQEGSTEPRMVTRAEAKRLAQADLEADPNFSNGVALKLLNEAVNNPTDALNRMLLDDIGMTQRDLRFGAPAILNEILGKAVNEPTNNFINILLTAGTNQVFYDNFFELKELGLEKGWLIPPGALEETPQGYVKVKANDIKAPGFSQLFGGYMVPQEFFDAMSEVYNPNDINTLTKGALRYNALAMRAATSLNLPGGPNRNFIGNIPFMIASGNLSLSKLGSAFKSTIANLSKMTDKQRQDYLVRAAKYGITDDNITSLISDYERISSNKTKMDYITEGLLGGNTRLLRKFGDVTNDLYQSVDNFWKFALWESEMDIVRKAEPQRDRESDQDFQDRVDRTAANRVASSLPFFSRMIDLGRIYRKPGVAAVVGSFIGFKSELIRLSYAGPMQAFADIKSGNPTYVKAGWRRVAGLSAVYSMFPTIAIVLKSLFDISDEEEEAARATLPPWEENANLLFWRDENGKINYFNTSFMNAYSDNTDWIRAFGREWDRKSETSKVDALVSASVLSLKEIGGPILELQIGTSAINEVYNNMTDNGRQVYNPEDSDMQKLNAISGHLLSSVIPTSIRKGQALGRSIQGIPERTGEVLGTPTAALNFLFAKTGTVEPEKSTRFTAFEINRRLRDAARLVTSTARSKGQVSDEELIASYDNANESYSQIIREAHKFYTGQLALGLSRQKAIALLREANISANIIKQIKNGYITPYQISEQTIKEIPRDRRNILKKQVRLQPKKISLKDD